MNCNHNYKCIDSREKKGGVRHRRYKCTRCNDRYSSIEIDKRKTTSEMYSHLLEDSNRAERNLALTMLLGISYDKLKALMGFLDVK